MLMHADDGGVYHLNSGVMGSGKRVDYTALRKRFEAGAGWALTGRSGHQPADNPC
jgi:hypothetical protein